MKIRAIVTGASGMVGEGVLRECLNHPDVEQVLVIGRRPSGYTRPKMKEILHKDFFNLTPIENELKGYNACYFCLGVSSVGMKEEEYYQKTYVLTMHMATILSKNNPDMTMTYVSGAHTDSTEKGSSMWARVKGKTENDLMKLPFKQVFAFRPGGMTPQPGAKNLLKGFKYFGWILPIMKVFFPKSVSKLATVGQAMIKVTLNGYPKKILEVSDINSFD